MPLFDRGGAGDDVQDYDPLFYRGKTPVLGAPVEIQTSGTLPGQFPAAAPAGPSASAPGAPPTAPGQFPAFGFDFGGMEMPAPPMGPGGAPSGLFGPGANAANPIAGGLALADKGGDVAGRLAQLRNAGWTPDASMMSPGDFWLPGAGGRLQGEGFGTNPATGEPESFGLQSGPFGGGGGGLNFSPGEIVPALGLGAGLYGAVTSPTASGKAFSSAGAASSGLTLAGDLFGVGALGAAGTGLGLAAAVPALGNLYNTYFGPDRPHWPTGYVDVPNSPKGEGAMAVDPSTGAILVYQGNGRYGWSDQTQQGQRATADQLRGWEIDPTGELAGLPGYAPIAPANRATRLEPDRATLAPSPTAGGGARPADVQQQASVNRQAVIDRLRAQHPGFSEGQLWALYQQTPEYQQELAFAAQYDPSRYRSGG